VTLRERHWWIPGALAAVVAMGAGTTFLLWPATRQPAPPPAQPTNPIALQVPLQTATIAAIAAHRGTTPTLFRLQEDRAVLVLDFPELHAQAQMLNRVAALIEKADMPRDRVVTETELDAHIQAIGGTPDAYYYGHDYRAADLVRFFQLAEAQAVPLNLHEKWLKDLLIQQGWFNPAAVGALISISGPTADIDATSRSTILRHELSHAVYFTDPAYVALSQHLWNDLLTDTEREAIKTFLAKDGYDTTDEDLMANEAQAYLIHTRDPRYFMPAMVGIDPAREAALRGPFLDAIPEPWLRDSALTVAPIASPAPITTTPVSDEPSSAPAHPPPQDHPAAATLPWRRPVPR
jgi:hypothetical protein